MTTQFDISALGLTVTEGGVYSFTLTPKAALGSDTVIRWEIVPKGELPISSSDFSALSGVVNFASGAVDAQTVTITPSDDSVLEVLKHFEIRVYEVVGDRDDTTTETDDILIGSQDVTLSDDETDDYGSSRLSSTGEANILTAANTQDLTTSGGGGDDIYIITRFQHGDVSISDTFGTNLVKFDAGVTITDYSETSVSFFGNVSILSVSLTLSTGAEVMIDAPLSFSFQLGDGETLSYADFKTAIGASGTNATSALAADYAVTTQTSVPDISGNTEDAPTQRLVSTGEADVLGAGGDFSFTASGGGGDDTYIITRFQHGDVSISDTFGTNLVKFDAGVTITDYSETSVSFFGNVSILSVSLTLSTGAEVMIDAPLPFSFQLGDGEVLSYAAFKTAIGASGTAGSSTLAADYTVTAPQTPTQEPEEESIIDAQTATEDVQFSFTIPADAFGTGTFTYEATLADGSDLPDWLTFNADTRTFSGEPAQSDTGTLSITVTATDTTAGTAITETFTLTVENTDNHDPVFVIDGPNIIVSGIKIIFTGDETVPLAQFYNSSGTAHSITYSTYSSILRIFTSHANLTLQDMVDLINANPAAAAFAGHNDARSDEHKSWMRAELVDPTTGGDALDYTAFFGGIGRRKNHDFVDVSITWGENADVSGVVFTARATDADNVVGRPPSDIITYELIEGQGDNSAFSIDTNTGEVRFLTNPDYETKTSYEVHVKAISTNSAGAGSIKEVTNQYTVYITDENDAPTVVREIGDQMANEGEVFTLYVSDYFTDINGNRLTYSASVSWLNYDSATQTLSGIPPVGTAGTFTITVMAADRFGATATEEFTITVIRPPNRPPSVARGIPDQVATEDTAFSFTFNENTFADADADTLTYTVLGNPSWLKFDADTRTFSGTPTRGATGIVSVTVIATDPDGETAMDSFTLAVENIDNNAPVFANATTTHTVVIQGIEFSYLGDALPEDFFVAFHYHTASNYVIEPITRNGAMGISIHFGPSTRQLVVDIINQDLSDSVASYLPHPVEDNRPDGDGDGNPDLIISARLLDPTTGSEIFNLPTSETQHPFITITTVPPITWDENSNTADVVFIATATDADNIVGEAPSDIITYELVAGAGDNSFFTIDRTTGEVRFVNTPDYEAQVSYEVHVKATSTSTLGAGGTRDVTAQYTVNLNDVNDAPIVVNAITDQIATEDAEFSFTFNENVFSDTDSGTLTYRAQLADGADLSTSWLRFDSNTRTFSGTPQNGDVGSLFVTVLADDGDGGVGTNTFIVTVENTNDAPTVVNEIADQRITETVEFSFTFDKNVFTDIDGDKLTYTVSGDPWWLDFNFITRTFSGIAPEGRAGTFSITVTADDNNGGTVSDTFDLTVVETGREINIHGLLFRIKDESAVDIVFQSTSSSSYVNYNEGTGRLTVWLEAISFLTLTLDDVIISLNTFFEDVDLDSDFTVELADGTDGSHKLNFGADDGDTTTIEVQSTAYSLPAVPVLANEIDDQTVTEGTEFSFTFGENVFADEDGDTLIYTAMLADGSPLSTHWFRSTSWLRFDSDTRTFYGRPGQNDTGTTLSVTVTATDPSGADVTDTFRITVLETGREVNVHGLLFKVRDTDVVDVQIQSTSTSSWAEYDSSTGRLTAWMEGGQYITLDDIITNLNRFFRDVNLNLDFEVKLAEGADGSHTINFGADDGDATTIEVVSGTVYTLPAAEEEEPPANNAPTVATAIPDQEATEGTEFILTFDAGVFTDADNDPLSYSATLADGSALSTSWLSFDADTRTFSGTPPEGSEGTVSVTVTASDGTNTVTDTFDIEIAAAGNTRPTVTQTAVTIEVARGATLALTDLADDIGWSDPDPDDSVFSYFKLDFSDPILGGRFYLDDEQKTAAELEALTSGAVEFRAGNKNGAPFSFTLQVGDGGDSGTDATDLLAPITITIDVL